MSSKAGYKYLYAYKLTIPIYDYTSEFCKRWVSKFSRTNDQMVQAARSGMQNIAEGYKQESLKGYIKLSGVSRGSLEELLNDYTAYARQNNISIWTKEKSEREIDEIGAIWNVLRYNDTLPDHPDFPDLPRNKVKAVNLMITIVNQSNYLIDKLIKSLEAKHEQEGGLSEKLYRKRVQYRKRYGK